ncbi:elongation factor P hydroxylase [Vibrio gallicus]|uniref:elongation factor P hydroxylase n=1 Tax=Vibrio gallicus TaxID=190897 RepID=UPI0021C40BF6|nr:elongation factor P hydroxylase [Vibrio gallicus]
MSHKIEHLIDIFDTTFFELYQTRLVSGDDEPIYLPADQTYACHRIIFAHGYYASALHEIAHWCVAGPKRRELEDFGYWYEPDGRDQQTQSEFERVEIRPQAYEWILARSAGFRFQVSCDNLNGDFEPDRVTFTAKVRQEVIKILQSGLPKRVQMLSNALRHFYDVPPLTEQDFKAI